jgi:hypothetical protein
MTAEIEATACPNCGAPLGGAYCAACGQKAGSLNPTLGRFLIELTQELLNVDGKIFLSLRLLLTRPGFLTIKHFAGRRVAYVSPLRLYLLFSVLFFATGQLVPSAANVEVFETNGSSIDREVLEQRTRQAIAAVSDAVNVWVPRAMFVLVPLFALLVMWARRRSGLHYLQHLYFASHVHAAWFCAFGVAGLASLAPPAFHVDTIASTVALLYAGWYFWFAFRRVYGTTLLGAFWRVVVVSAVYGLVVAAAVVAIVLPPALRVAYGAP